MRYFIGVLLFLIAMIGGCIYILKKVKVKPLLALILLFTFIPLIVYFSGLLNIMTFTCYFLYSFCIIYFLYSLFKNRDELKKFLLDKDIILVLVLLLFVSIFYIRLHPMHYDNFTHWAKIVKDIFINNALPNFENSVIEFKSYQPGTACFIYFVSLLLGKTEGVMCVAQNYILIVFSCSLLLLIRKTYVSNNLLKSLLIIFIIFISAVSVPFYDLLVDNILSVVMIACCVIAFIYRKNTKKLFWFLLPLTLYLTIIKNSGIILAGFNCFFLLVSALKYNKRDFLYCIYLGLICLFSLYLWQNHVAYVFGESGLLAKHSFSLSNFKATLAIKGIDGIKTFIVFYLKHFFDFNNNINQVIMLICNLFFILMLVCFNKHRKLILKITLIANFIYLAYYVILCLMYLVSMDVNGSFELAGFDRYMYTVTFIVISILIGLIFYITNFKNYKYSGYIFSIILLLCFICFISVNKQVDLKAFLGIQQYKKTYLYKLDELSSKIPSDIKSTDVIYVYNNGLVENVGECMFASRYKFRHNYTIIINELDEINHEQFKTMVATIVILKSDDEVKRYLSQNDYKKITDGIYQKDISV